MYQFPKSPKSFIFLVSVTALLTGCTSSTTESTKNEKAKQSNKITIVENDESHNQKKEQLNQEKKQETIRYWANKFTSTLKKEKNIRKKDPELIIKASVNAMLNTYTQRDDLRIAADMIARELTGAAYKKEFEKEVKSLKNATMSDNQLIQTGELMRIRATDKDKKMTLTLKNLDTENLNLERKLENVLQDKISYYFYNESESQRAHRDVIYYNQMSLLSLLMFHVENDILLYDTKQDDDRIQSEIKSIIEISSQPETKPNVNEKLDTHLKFDTTPLTLVETPAI